MSSRLGDLRLYKFDVPSYSDVGIILVTEEHRQSGCRFQLTQFTGEKEDSQAAGLSKAFVDLLSYSFFYSKKDFNITNQILTYLISNFSFKYLEIVPPACPVLVFHFHIRELHHTVPAPEIDILEAVMEILGVKPYILDIADVHEDSFVSIAPSGTEIVDCYQGEELCCLCGKGYRKEKEIVYKTTVCNHIFHATCISSHLLSTHQCPICSMELVPVDIRTVLFQT